VHRVQLHNKLALKTVSEMTQTVSGGVLNSTPIHHADFLLSEQHTHLLCVYAVCDWEKTGTLLKDSMVSLYPLPTLPYLTFRVDVTCRWHPVLRPPGGLIALPW